MVATPLLDPVDLAAFPGAPFDLTVVHAASESVRDDAGWHIAPQVQETVEVEGDGGRHLLLPSLKVETVHTVTIGGDPVSGWTLLPGVRLYRPAGWPARKLVTVTMTHGYETVPGALLPVVAARCQRSMVDAVLTQRSETVGARTSSEAYNINRLELEAGASGLDRYTLPPAFA